MKRNPVTAFAESRIQCAIVKFLSHALPKTCLFYSVPNGGYGLPKATAARLKREGLRPGVADLVILRQGGWTAYVEVKTDDGEQSDAQIEFADWCGENGVEYAVVRSIDDVEAALRAWNVPLRGSVQ